MIESEIVVKALTPTTKANMSPTQYQEWVARFCYAAAKMPPATVEQILSLMEVASEAEPDEHHQ